MGKTRQQRTPDLRGQLARIMERALLGATVFVVFSVPLFFSPSISEYGYGKTVYALVAISLLTILWSATAWVKGSWSLRFPWITFPLLGFVAAGLLSLLSALNGRVVSQSLLLVCFFFQLLLIIADTVRTRHAVHLTLVALLSAGVFAGLYGLLQHIGLLRGPFGGTGLDEVISVMGNRNYLGGFLTYLLFPSAILVISVRTQWLRLLACGMIAFSFGIVLLVDQAATIVALIATTLAFIAGVAIFRSYDAIRRQRRWIVALLALLAITFAVHAPSSPLNALVGLSSDEPGLISQFWRSQGGTVREIDFWVGWEMFKDSPLVGLGLGHYKIRFLEYKSAFLSTPRGAAYDISVPPAAQAHNDYVQVLAEVGILGTLAVVGFLMILGLSIWRRARRATDTEERLELLLLACGILPFLIHAAVSFPAHLPASSLVFVTLVGLVFSRAYGDEAVIQRTLPLRWIRPVTVALSIVGVTVSLFAVSDLYANVLMQRGIAQLHQGNPEAAEQLLQQSLRYDFAPRQTLYFLAHAQVQQGRFGDAWDNLERCHTRYLDEGVCLMYANLAATRGETDKAQDTLEILLRGNPASDVEQQARYIQALIAFQVKEYEQAVSLLESLTEDHPSYELGFLALGDLYAMLGRPVGARRVLERALALIDWKINRAQARLDAATAAMPLSEYGQIQLDLQRLSQQRRIAGDRLAELP